ncbi:hypothetical protein [Leifsonia sp. TF02-11]|uniref:hypothetical protein n=1 Tax=Leifsonia sp. TF02-11 TaxID=2815212 RepID=UPI001AA101A3|nr:hypothetical protein [Leifsonia sp. TF02-11]MBO1741471.1 hypothetical protein [Leifsonia sp. TF02-11]
MNTQNRSPSTELEVGAVLANALPATLLTPESPERYTVAAVFTRRPARTEIDAIHDNRTRETLSTAGYPTVELRVSDRRLEIANTNLEELTGGLASVIAERLHEISVGAAAAHDRFEAEVLERTQREADRTALVALAAAAVTFVRADSAIPEPVSRWENEGGSADGGRPRADRDRPATPSLPSSAS